MRTTRRDFLKLGGACGLVFLVFPAVKGLAAGERQEGVEGLVRKLAMTGQEGSSSAPSRAGTRKSKWGLLVDMEKCWSREGCLECILACRREHNIPDIPTPKEEIKWIWKEPFANVFPEQEHEYWPEALPEKPVVILCNHCDNPACVRVCPTKATYKRADGIVMMDYHRCIGCRYCMAACPYGARSFNFRDPRPFIKETNPSFPTREKGVVEKCNLCVERIDAGLKPACVEACPAGALIFGNLEDPNSKIREKLRSFLTIQRKSELGTRPKVYYALP